MRPELAIDGLLQQHKAVRFNFITAELGLAMTFCQLAVSTHSDESARRNVGNARRAYATAKRAFKGAHLDATMNREIMRQINLLKPVLGKLPRN